MKLSDFDFRIWDNKDNDFLETKLDFLCIAKKDKHKDFERILDVAEDCSGYESSSYFDYTDDRYEIELWTGLCDKSGKKIYEGDIITLCHFGQKWIGVVWFGRNGFVITSKDENAEQGGELSYFEKYFYDFEVVGNIHENKDLLENS
ncbi:hypothetical protein FPD46_06325 [Campylobacter peloridis]|uniref:YopX protein domain-containing protein n=1 Tax=Campylobacter peloridis TaxID=488546 RepID=A0A5C7DVT1_9BACT|nr:YopX family protein [Campylobacter peloridis]TXE79677.1 hypothetical protein FPD46_06325 [Campylobacter peloridis]